jgi:hypothetical protein
MLQISFNRSTLLTSWYPMVLKYLGLAPGSRFLITPEYEDVWVVARPHAAATRGRAAAPDAGGRV